MPRTRKSRPPSLKAKVEVENHPSAQNGSPDRADVRACPTQVGGWKKQALAGLPDIFSNGREQMRRQSDLPAVALPGLPSARCGSAGGRQQEHQAGEK